MSFPARYPGRCVECDDSIYEGDFIVITDDGPVHKECAPDEPHGRGAPEVVCPICFLTSCDCEVPT